MDAWPTIASYSQSAAQILRQEAEQAGGRLYTEEYRLPYELFFEPQTSIFSDCRSIAPDGLCVHADRRVFQSARYGELQEDGWIY